MKHTQSSFELRLRDLIYSLTQHWLHPEEIEEIIQLVETEIIGEDERHQNGKNMINPWTCDDCGMAEEPFTRNKLRAAQRKALKGGS